MAAVISPIGRSVDARAISRSLGILTADNDDARIAVEPGHCTQWFKMFRHAEYVVHQVG